MVEKIIVGRDKQDLEKFGDRGTVFIGKHVVGEGEDAHLTNPVFMDVSRPHIILVTGKRGSGKSHTAGVIAEEMTLLPKEIKQNLSVLMIDTMGIYWSMKKPNDKDRELLDQWSLKPQVMDMQFFIPKGLVPEYKKAGVDYDFPFTLPCGEISSTDWIISFGFNPMDDYGLLTERVIKNLQKTLGSAYSIQDIIKAIGEDTKVDKKIKDALTSRFISAEGWGIFEKVGTPVDKFFSPGKISVIDISHYVRSGTGWSVRSMVIGLFSRKVFQARLMARKKEEIEVITGEKKKSVPMVWIIIDEAHQFVPSQGKTAATEPILTLVKEGREPGISMLMITQIPNKLHPDVLAQSDLVISHRLTSEADITALQGIMQSYAQEDIQTYINQLPKTKGSAIIMDDNSERIFQIQIRPRLSWHAGGSPKAIKERGLFDEV
jgi:DNA helicase HerA-like ATPase